MNLKTKMNNVLFLDIETVPQKENWSEVPEIIQELFSKKTAYQRKEEFTAENFYERAGIWAEFGKIICISVAYFTNNEQERNLRVTSFSGDNEEQILLTLKNCWIHILINHIMYYVLITGKNLIFRISLEE